MAAVRSYFAARGVLEVDTPMLSRAATTDPNIESFAVCDGPDRRYLHTSPEFAMKRLLAAGCGDIYQVCHVFRREEAGRFHNPEFTLLEWYRVGWSLDGLIGEVAELIEAVARALGHAGGVRLRRFSYGESFAAALGVDPHTASLADLQAAARRKGVEVIGHLARSDWLDLLFSRCVACAFPAAELTVIDGYPAEQAALARLKPGEPPIAERFEVFAGPLELANGFHELEDPAAQAARFAADNRRRKAAGKAPMPADTRLIEALEAGLPDCCGVALGLDRLLMWLEGLPQLQQTLSFAWDRA